MVAVMLVIRRLISSILFENDFCNHLVYFERWSAISLH
jgi:hypothetical protein